MGRTLAIISLALFIGLAVSCNLHFERTHGWTSDLDFYISQVKSQHYVYRDKALPPEFTSAAEKLRKNFSNYSDQRILLEFEFLAAALGDGHTYVLPWAAASVKAYALPLRLYLLSDGLFVIDASNEMKDLIGHKILSIGGITASDAMQTIGSYISRDNDEGIKWIGPVFLSLQGALEAIGAEINEGIVKLSLEDSTGNNDIRSVALQPMTPMRGIPKLFPSKITSRPAPLYLQNVSDNYWVTSLKDSTQSVYFQFNQVMNKDEESLAAFCARLNDTLIVSGARHLIVDVRHNNGGNAEILYPLLDVMDAFQKANGSASITIITGRNTFSAAQIFISKCDRLFHPVFAGEASSSRPNFVGEENGIVLPYSGAMCSISNRYHESIPGDSRKAIEPGILVLLSSSDYFNNEDPVMRQVLDQ